MLLRSSKNNECHRIYELFLSFLLSGSTKPSPYIDPASFHLIITVLLLFQDVLYVLLPSIEIDVLPDAFTLLNCHPNLLWYDVRTIRNSDSSLSLFSLLL